MRAGRRGDSGVGFVFGQGPPRPTTSTTINRDPSVDPHVVAIKGLVSHVTRIADIDVMLATPVGDVLCLVEIEDQPLSPKGQMHHKLQPIIMPRLRVLCGVSNRPSTENVSLILGETTDVAFDQL